MSVREETQHLRGATDVQPGVRVPALGLPPEVVDDFWRGVWAENGLMRLALGLCPALAVTTTAVNGLGMGLATTLVLVGANLVVSMLRKIIPNRIRIPSFIVVIASFVTVVDLSMAAYVPDLHHALGIFIPLIVTNCIVLGRAEAFASRHPLSRALADGLGVGVGFTVALVILGLLREFFGAGTLFGLPVLTGLFSLFHGEYKPILVAVLPPGAFIFLGFMVAAMNKVDQIRKQRAQGA